MLTCCERLIEFSIPFTYVLNVSCNYSNLLINELNEGAGGQIHGTNGFLNACSVKLYTFFLKPQGEVQWLRADRIIHKFVGKIASRQLHMRCFACCIQAVLRMLYI